MHQAVKQDLTWSTKLFIDHVWPTIRKHAKLGELIVMEGRPDQEIATHLDVRSGIDGIELTLDGGLRGIASRVQVGHAWRSFTVRTKRDSGAETEYAKRLKAFTSDSGKLYPHYTVQAYTTATTVAPNVIGICKTRDLIQFITDGFHKTNRTTNAEFAICFWSEMQIKGFPVQVIE